MNKYNAPFYESVATTGIGIQDTLKAITKLVLLHLTQKYDPKARAAGKVPGVGKKLPMPAPAAPIAAASPSVVTGIPLSGGIDMGLPPSVAA